ncbi:MAG: VOC family protein [Gammaproteobacteria bacterium]|nr:VOC family protein [Gammaproteobacteria bacterium]
MTIIPEGFQTVTPYVFTDQSLEFASFLKRAFDATEVGRTILNDGTIANLQIRIGTVTMMVSEANQRYPAMPAAYYIYVENADDSMARAIDAGASLELKVMDMSYGDRQGGVVDAFGNIWWISQRLSDQPYFD